VPHKFEVLPRLSVLLAPTIEFPNIAAEVADWPSSLSILRAPLLRVENVIIFDPAVPGRARFPPRGSQYEPLKPVFHVSEIELLQVA
jgi:hypothetical protein